MTLQKYRFEFWESRPKPLERRAKIKAHLEQAKLEYVNRSQLKMLPVDLLDSPASHCFVVNNRIVCEKAYAFLIGQIDDTGDKFRMWNDEVQASLGKYIYCICKLIDSVHQS
jgi:hypothetical protein